MYEYSKPTKLDSVIHLHINRLIKTCEADLINLKKILEAGECDHSVHDWDGYQEDMFCEVCHVRIVDADDDDLIAYREDNGGGEDGCDCC